MAKSLMDYPSGIRQMTKDESYEFVGACFLEMQTGTIPYNECHLHPQVSAGYPIYNIMNDRLKGTGSKAVMTLPLALFLSYLSNGNPGNAVMWAFTVHRMSIKLDKEVIDTSDFANEFPNGIPDEATMRQCWDDQKDRGGNLLDMMNTWKEAA